MSEERITIDGVVAEVLSNGLYRVAIQNGKHEVIAHLKGKIRMHNIRIVKGDSVTVEMSPYDIKKGRIIYRKRA